MTDMKKILIAMNEIHTKIQPSAGSTIEECVTLLLNHKNSGKLVCCEFNGIPLYSDSVSMDSAYVLIMGMTKAEYDKSQQESLNNHKRQEREHEVLIPELSKTWIEKGREVLTEDKWELWEKVVPIRLADLYNGMELGACLDIVKVLNTGGTMEDAKAMINNQGHSGMSFGLVRSMVKTFADRGEEFFKYVV